VDAGRMVVELRVAPSVPLSFISVRLAQSGARLSVSEEL
jgi:phage tail sheath protein FI